MRGLDPFLLLDEFGSDAANDYIAGFPPHPHRGFETVTYMLEGRMLHEDHLGHQGPAVVGRGAMDDRRARRDPLRDAAAGVRAHARASALDQSARQGQADRSGLPASPGRDHPGGDPGEWRSGEGDRRGLRGRRHPYQRRGAGHRHRPALSGCAVAGRRPGWRCRSRRGIARWSI